MPSAAVETIRKPREAKKGLSNIGFLLRDARCAAERISVDARSGPDFAAWSKVVEIAAI
jgi:hypothetical protein